MRWWAISCSRLTCRWRSTRRAATVEDATARTCPRCGGAVLAAPTLNQALATVTFRHDGSGGGDR